ncbi:MAG: hypothetical protein E7437_02075 [Ruminococcaceae bacterium]|nr:hypothetical protein [Oscillospiraceae bacterium]
MKWNEMTMIQRGVCIIGVISGFSYLFLSALDLFDLLPISKGVLFPLFSVFWLNLGMIQKVKKHAIWYYIIAAGYVVLALPYLFF